MGIDLNLVFNRIKESETSLQAITIITITITTIIVTITTEVIINHKEHQYTKITTTIIIITSRTSPSTIITIITRCNKSIQNNNF